MELIFEDKAYHRLEVDASYSRGFPAAVVTLYRSRLQLLRAAHHHRDLVEMRCLYFHLLPGRSRRQHSIRLTDQYSLIVELKKQPDVVAAQILVVRVDQHEPDRSTPP